MAIYGDIGTALKQAAGTNRLRKALEFAAEVANGGRTDLRHRAAQLKAGESFEVELQQREVFAIFQAYQPRQRKDGFFEAHKEHTDVQFLLQGEEYIEVCPLHELNKSPAYDENNNVFFPLAPEPGSRFTIRPGVLAVLFPADAHAPTLQAGNSTGLNLKVVIKVHNALPA